MVRSTLPRPDTPPPAPPRRRTQLERRTEAESRMLTSAREIIAAKGSVGMTLAEVGLAAGYSRGLAAHHFGTKAALLRALAARINEEFMQEVSAAVPRRQEGMEAVIGFVATYLDRRDKRWINTRALLVLMAEAATTGSETGEALAMFNRQVVSLLEQQFRAGIANGDMRPELEPHACAAIVIGALRGIMMQRLLHDSALDMAPIATELREMVVRSFAREPQRWARPGGVSAP